MEKKIAVASDDGIKITGHIGRCEMFLVFTINENKIQNIEKRLNTFTHRREGHQRRLGNFGDHVGRHFGIIEGLKDCNTIICSAAGPGLVTDLQNNGIEVIITDEINAEDAVNLYLEGILNNYPDRTCREHKH